MSMQMTATVRMFGALHAIRRAHGLEPMAEVHIHHDGCPACDLARELDLPLERIEAVFVNHRVYRLDHVILPGDRVAFVPTGIPGPGRLLLGIFGAGRQNRQQEL
ncbi:MAG: MoaD/ThiS family protein [Desulfuromonadaceae bacterium]|nr:MoaD/ThiS family protein [Desulfuromonadaceae bacterium]